MSEFYHQQTVICDNHYAIRKGSWESALDSNHFPLSFLHLNEQPKKDLRVYVNAIAQFLLNYD